MIVDPDTLDETVDDLFLSYVEGDLISRMDIDNAVRRCLKDTLIRVQGYLKDIEYEQASIQTRDLTHEIEYAIYHLDV